MTIAILATKLYVPPPRLQIVHRAHLIERLSVGLRQNQGFGRKLTLICAPAGFGKTTLISEWIQTFRQAAATASPSSARPLSLPIAHAVAWLSLDEKDNDPARFLTYLVAALQTVKAEFGAGVMAALQSPQSPTIDTLLTTLLNEISTLTEPFVLVLDDYHAIESKAIDSALTFLLDHLPPQMHLVITTREDPNLPLARYRARAQLTEVRANDLRFTPAEAADFLNQVMGLKLSREEITSLESRTEGWIAGLQLAALSMQGRSDTSTFIRAFTGDHHFILDYLVEEVLHHQPAAVRHFLLQTAILDRLCGALCDAVTGQEAGNARSTGSGQPVCRSAR